jgi:hypothetical protein
VSFQQSCWSCAYHLWLPSHNVLLSLRYRSLLTPEGNGPTVCASEDASHPRSKGPRVTWETPEFVEIKMDAEIGSYQDDFGDDPH